MHVCSRSWTLCTSSCDADGSRDQYHACLDGKTDLSRLSCRSCDCAQVSTAGDSADAAPEDRACSRAACADAAAVTAPPATSASAAAATPLLPASVRLLLSPAPSPIGMVPSEGVPAKQACQIRSVCLSTEWARTTPHCLPRENSQPLHCSASSFADAACHTHAVLHLFVTLQQHTLDRLAQKARGSSCNCILTIWCAVQQPPRGMVS